MKIFTILSLSLLILAFEVSESFSGNVSDYANTSCDRDSENLNQCIIDVWETFKSRMGAGIPKFKIPRLEPLSLPSMKIDNRSDFMSIKAIVNPLIVTGVSQAKIDKLDVMLKNLSGTLSLTVANMNVSALYVMDAIIMQTTRIKGQGQLSGKISNAEVILNAEAELGPKDERGKSYLKVKLLKLKVLAGDAKIRLKDTTRNLQNRFATETANAFYESNRRVVLETWTPIVEEYIESVATDIVNDVFSTTAYEDMLK